MEVGEVLELDAAAGKTSWTAVTNSSRKASYSAPRTCGLAEPEVERVGEQGLVVGADVQCDGQGDLGRHARAGDQRQLADRDAHAVDAQVAEAEDALPVGDHDEANVLLRPVAEDLLDPAPALDGEVEAAGPAEDVAELLAGLADGGGVDQRHEVGGVRHQRLVVERLVVVLQRGQVDVPVEVGGLMTELEEDAAELVLLGIDAFGDQAGQAEASRSGSVNAVDLFRRGSRSMWMP